MSPDTDKYVGWLIKLFLLPFPFPFLSLSFVLSIELTTFLEHSTIGIPTHFICYIYIWNKNKAWDLLHFYSFEKSNFLWYF